MFYFVFHFCVGDQIQDLVLARQGLYTDLNSKHLFTKGEKNTVGRNKLIQGDGPSKRLSTMLMSIRSSSLSTGSIAKRSKRSLSDNTTILIIALFSLAKGQKQSLKWVTSCAWCLLFFHNLLGIAKEAQPLGIFSSQAIRTRPMFAERNHKILGMSVGDRLSVIYIPYRNLQTSNKGYSYRICMFS